MNEMQLAALVKTALVAGLTTLAIVANVKQDYQPTGQGLPSTPTIYFHLGDSSRIGWPSYRNTFNGNQMIRTKTELMTRTLQISATAIVVPDADNSQTLTANDLIDYAVSILNDASTLAFFAASQVQVDRIKGTRQTYFKDDKGRDEASPTFECTVIYPKVTTSVIGSTKVIKSGVYPI